MELVMWMIVFLCFSLFIVVLFMSLRFRKRIANLKKELSSSEASQAALTQQRSRAEEDAQQRQSLLSLVDKTSKTLSSALSKDKLLRLILETTTSVARCDMGFLMLYDYTVDEFAYELGYGMEESMLLKARFPLTERIIDRIMTKREILTFPISKSGGQREYFSFREEKMHLLGNAVTLFSIPLVVEDRMMGLVTLYCPEDSSRFLNNNRTLLSIITNQASVALGSAIQAELAILDRLTMLYNRGYFQRRLTEEIARCRRYKLTMSLIMLDIDHFKFINDTYGHPVGDEVLKTIAHILKKNTRIVDLCARYGGEEFIVMLPETDLKGALAVAERERKLVDISEMGGAVGKAEGLRKVVEGLEIATHEKKIRATISLGISAWRFPVDKDVDGETLVKQADEQLYRAKESGRNRVCYPELEVGGA